MKLNILYEDGHFDIVPNYPGSMVSKKSNRKRRRLNAVPNIASWQKGYDKKTKTKQMEV